MDLETYGWFFYGGGVVVTAVFESTRRGLLLALTKARAKVGPWKDVDSSAFVWRNFIANALLWPCVFWMYAVAFVVRPIALRRAKYEDSQRRLGDDEGPQQESPWPDAGAPMSTTKSP